MILAKINTIIEQLAPVGTTSGLQDISKLHSKDFDKWRRAIDKHFSAGITLELCFKSYRPYSRGGYIITAIGNDGEYTLLVNKEDQLKRCETIIDSESVFYCNAKPYLHFEIGLVFLSLEISMFPGRVKGKSVSSYQSIRTSPRPAQSHKPWSQAQDQLLKDRISQDVGIIAIATEMQRSGIAIVDRMIKLGICAEDVGVQLKERIKSHYKTNKNSP
ncbi:hypothetical protein BOO92_13850 [Vibrio navarrensis]|uniref:hypothetical protein n=1 Tax=Vibrio navarrensis TaxID=29495 RepID=UPI0018681788|nr:hypothetical protein [Vibrio navarrensis]MBE3657761.1 hypothetical protein [Vibrio navarrensis]